MSKLDLLEIRGWVVNMMDETVTAKMAIKDRVTKLKFLNLKLKEIDQKLGINQ